MWRVRLVGLGAMLLSCSGGTLASEPAKCPAGSKWNGSQCVREASCPSGTRWDGSRCVATAPPPARTPRPTPSSSAGTCPSGTVLVAAGSFQMGSTQYDDEKPVRSVHLEAFCIDKTEVTVSAYRSCVSAGRCSAPDTENQCNWGRSGRDDHPINCVNHDQATAYCSYRGMRLPTEAEWEKAARGTDGRNYPWGNAAPSSQACWNRWDGKLGTCQVGSYPEGASPYGALDMAGNVWEWVADWYGKDYYASAAKRNPTGPPAGSYRVLRGGCWFDIAADGLRASYRFTYPLGGRGILGFRCARPPR